MQLISEVWQYFVFIASYFILCLFQEGIDNAKEDVYRYFMKECVGKFDVKSLQFQTW